MNALVYDDKDQGIYYGKIIIVPQIEKRKKIEIYYSKNMNSFYQAQTPNF